MIQEIGVAVLFILSFLFLISHYFGNPLPSKIAAKNKKTAGCGKTNGGCGCYTSKKRSTV